MIYLVILRFFFFKAMLVMLVLPEGPCLFNSFIITIYHRRKMRRRGMIYDIYIYVYTRFTYKKVHRLKPCLNINKFLHEYLIVSSI
jgi:hypothetical protein